MQNLRVRNFSFIIHPVPCVQEESQWCVLKDVTSYNKLSSILTVSLFPLPGLWYWMLVSLCQWLYCCHLWISGCDKMAAGPSAKSAFGSDLFYWLRYQNLKIWLQEMLSRDWKIGVHSTRTMEGIKSCNTYDEQIERVKTI